MRGFVFEVSRDPLTRDHSSLLKTGRGLAAHFLQYSIGQVTVGRSTGE